MSGPFLMFDKQISVSALPPGYRLVPGTEGSLGLPIEAFLRLYAVDASGTAKRVETLSDVLALVKEVRSEMEALQLLQLETAPDTHFLFKNSRYLDVHVCTPIERVGDMTEAAAVAAGYRNPSLEVVEDGYQLSRDLVRLKGDDAPALVRRNEHLSRTASYRLLSESTISLIDESKIMLPDYE